MMHQQRVGLTALELCVALMLVGALSSLAAVQFTRRPRLGQPASSLSLSLALRTARTAALRSGIATTGAAWHSGEWVEYTVLPTGRVLLDSVANARAENPSELRAGRVEAH